MDTFLFLVIFSVLSLIYLIIGFIASRTIKDTTDYFLAGRNLGFFAVTFTLIATQLGGNMVIGASDSAYNYGMYGIAYAMGIALGFLLLSTGFAGRLHACNIATTAELFKKKFSSPALAKIASLVSIVSLWGLLVSTVLASKSFLVGLGVENELILLIFWAFIVIYTMIGGLKAVVLTDIVQVLFIIVLFGGIFAYCLFFQPAGLFSLKEMVAQQSSPIIAKLDIMKVLATFLMPALFALMEQDLAQRFFAARTKKIALTAAFGAVLFIIIFGFIPVYFGMQAKLIGLPVVSGGNSLVALLEFITQRNFIFTLAVCSIIAAITSTADSLLCAISSNLAQDFNYSWIGKINHIMLSQFMTVFAGVGAYAASYLVTQKQIIDVAVTSYEFSVSCLLIPFLVALFKDNLNKNAAIGAAIFGLVGFIIFRIYPVPFAKEVVTLGLSAIGYLIGNLIIIKKRPQLS